MHLRTAHLLGYEEHVHHLGREGIKPPVNMRLVRHGSKPMRQAAAPEGCSAYFKHTM